jgi:hypothetical protein
VIFRCGTAARPLRETGVDVVAIGPGLDFQSERWWAPSEIQRVFPTRFDATSGHLPVWLLIRLARTLYEQLGHLDAPAYEVPTGSGETVTCLRWAYPDVVFHAAYDNRNPATRFEIAAPMTALVQAMGPVVARG